MRNLWEKILISLLFLLNVLMNTMASRDHKNFTEYDSVAMPAEFLNALASYLKNATRIDNTRVLTSGLVQIVNTEQNFVFKWNHNEAIFYSLSFFLCNIRKIFFKELKFKRKFYKRTNTACKSSNV